MGSFGKKKDPAGARGMTVISSWRPSYNHGDSIAQTFVLVKNREGAMPGSSTRVRSTCWLFCSFPARQVVCWSYLVAMLIRSLLGGSWRQAGAESETVMPPRGGQRCVGHARLRATCRFPRGDRWVACLSNEQSYAILQMSADSNGIARASRLGQSPRRRPRRYLPRRN